MSKTIFNCKSLIIGHRGAKGDIMENTIESILYAIKTGVDGVEFDVQRCYTGELVLYHDETLDRLAFKDQFYFGKTRGKKIQNLQWYHLYNTELIDSLGRKYKIPKLVDILRHPTVYNSDVLINIEIKDHRSHEELVDLISDLVDEGLYNPGRFLVSSYLLDSLIYLYEFKEEAEIKDLNYQKFKIGWIFCPETIPVGGLLNSIKSHLKVLTHIILDKDMINTPLIDETKEMGLGVFVYTINQESDYPIPNLHNIVEGIITDKPKIFLSLVESY